MKEIVNDRFVANGKSWFDSFENSKSSPHSKQVIGLCSHCQKFSSIYGDFLKLDQQIVQSSVAITEERFLLSQCFLLLNAGIIRGLQ